MDALIITVPFFIHTYLLNPFNKIIALISKPVGLDWLYQAGPPKHSAINP